MKITLLVAILLLSFNSFAKVKIYEMVDTVLSDTDYLLVNESTGECEMIHAAGEFATIKEIDCDVNFAKNIFNAKALRTNNECGTRPSSEQSSFEQGKSPGRGCEFTGNMRIVPTSKGYRLQMETSCDKFMDMAFFKKISKREIKKDLKNVPECIELSKFVK